MTGTKFEQEFCEILNKCGWWALRIPRNESGAQPFDVIAVNEHYVECYDCKVVSSENGRFPLSRIEDNQWLAFERFETQTNRASSCGLAILYAGNIYFIPHYILKKLVRQNEKSIDLKDRAPMLTSAQINKILGRTLR